MLNVWQPSLPVCGIKVRSDLDRVYCGGLVQEPHGGTIVCAPNDERSDAYCIGRGGNRVRRTYLLQSCSNVWRHLPNQVPGHRGDVR
jgi:hypothetical protein